MNIECHIGTISPGLDVYGPLTGLTDFITKHFFAESNKDIEFTCVGPEMVSSPLPPRSSVSALELHHTLSELTGNPITGPISRIGVILAKSYDPYPPALGVMFDRGFTTDDDPNGVDIFTAVPREGCAVFLGSIFDLRGKGGKDQYLAEVLFTIVHELGHVFNLQHETSSPNFMAISKKEAPFGPIAYHFNADQQRWLSQCSTNASVWPGGKPFMDTGTDSNLNTPDFRFLPSAPFGLELVISCGPREFWQFEPIQLDIELRRVGESLQSLDVPDEIDPGYRRFRIMIEDPLGECRLYRSTKHFCGKERNLKIEKNASFRRDIPIFGQAGGYTFRRAGLHRLWVEFEMNGGVVRSNTLEVFVKPEYGTDSVRERDRHHLSNPRIAKVLFYREDLADSKGVNMLGEYIDRFPNAPSAGEIHYVLGRASLAHAIRGGNIKNLHRKAAAHLKRALDHEQLGAYRRDKAQSIIDNLPIATRRNKVKFKK